MTVTADTDEAMEKEIPFGDQKIKVSDLAEWLGEAAKSSSRWTMATSIAAVAAAFLAFVAVLIALLAWFFPMQPN